MSKVSSRPPLKKQETQQTTADLQKQFIQHGDIINIKPTKSIKVYPWEAENVRDDVIKSFNLRFPESYFLKLEYIAKQTRRSKHGLCFEVIKEMIDSEINNMT